VGAGHAHTLYVHGHSRVHRLAPEAKLAAALAFVLAAALTPRGAVWVFAIDALMLVIVGRLARLRPSFVLARLVVILPFVLFAFLIPFISSGEQVEVLGLNMSREGLWGTWNILAKATLGATVSIMLAATTEVPDILAGMDRLHFPPALTQIGAFMIRYLELITDELRRMRTAMTARGYDPRWLWQAGPIAASAGALFIRSFERGERVHAAMLSRGYTGAMPVIDERRARAREWAGAAVVPTLALSLAIAAIAAMP
jgi:cobalt/nickel transport system permease protein